MTVRIVTADTFITLDNSSIRVPAGTLVDVEPGSALETAYGANLAWPSRYMAQLATGGELPELRRGLDGKVRMAHQATVVEVKNERGHEPDGST